MTLTANHDNNYLFSRFLRVGKWKENSLLNHYYNLIFTGWDFYFWRFYFYYRKESKIFSDISSGLGSARRAKSRKRSNKNRVARLARMEQVQQRISKANSYLRQSYQPWNQRECLLQEQELKWIREHQKQRNESLLKWYFQRRWKYWLQWFKQYWRWWL